MTKALEDVSAERLRQVETEGWTPEHDDGHKRGELTSASMAYLTNALVYVQVAAMGVMSPDALLEKSRTAPPTKQWPWDVRWWKPTTPRRNLVKAAALIIAEIERLDRQAPSP